MCIYSNECKRLFAVCHSTEPLIFDAMIEEMELWLEHQHGNEAYQEMESDRRRGQQKKGIRKEVLEQLP